MTLRAVIIGLLCAAVLAGITYFSDKVVMRISFLIGSYLPMAVFGILVLFITTVNPVLARIHHRFRLAGREIAVIACIVLVTCFIPGRGLIHHFGTCLMMPHQMERSNVGWTEKNLIRDVPERMLADVSTNDTIVLNGFIGGLADEDEIIPVSAVPWYAWKRTLLFWMPLTLALAIGAIGLALVVHRQWSSHECLTYPIAIFTRSLLGTGDDAEGSVLKNRMFIGSILTILALRMYNYCAHWWPDYLVAIPETFDLSALTGIWPDLLDGSWILRYMLKRMIIILPIVIGFAYFLPSDVSLSLGISPFVYGIILWSVQRYGIFYETAVFLLPAHETFAYGGAYFAFFSVLVYTGRRYYLNVFRRAFCFRTQDSIEPGAVWGARVFLIGATFFCVQLCIVGLDWPLALLYTFVSFVILTVLSRIVAETGAFFLQSYFYPCAFVLGLMGLRAVGPQQAIIMAIVSAVFFINQREIVMPFAVQAAKISDDAKATPGKTLSFGGIAAAASLVIAIGVSLFLIYQHGSGVLNENDTWVGVHIPRTPFETNISIREGLQSQGMLEASQAVSGLGRFAVMQPKWPSLMAFGIGFALVALFSAARLRFTWWPLHPVMFLMLGSWNSMLMAVSFLMGCAIKSVVKKYGGAKAHSHLKPAMIGLVAGEMLSAIIIIMIGSIYFFFTKKAPVPYTVF